MRHLIWDFIICKGPVYGFSLKMVNLLWESLSALHLKIILNKNLYLWNMVLPTICFSIRMVRFNKGHNSGNILGNSFSG